MVIFSIEEELGVELLQSGSKPLAFVVGQLRPAHWERVGFMRVEEGIEYPIDLPNAWRVDLRRHVAKICAIWPIEAALKDQADPLRVGEGAHVIARPSPAPGPGIRLFAERVSWLAALDGCKRQEELLAMMKENAGPRVDVMADGSWRHYEGFVIWWQDPAFWGVDAKWWEDQAGRPLPPPKLPQEAKALTPLEQWRRQERRRNPKPRIRQR